MKATETYLIDYMDGANTRFRIPIYQRNYNWLAKDQCQQLWEDLIFIDNEQKKNHFFGSIVSASDPSGDKTRIIIDGQQRLTTISLLLAAIVNKCKVAKEKDPSLPLPNLEEIENLYLGKRTKTEKLKLKLTKDDMHAFEQVCEGNIRNVPNSNIVKNYNFFFEKINLGNAKNIYESIKKLQIVDISITAEDSDPQLIFESLNDYGMGLTDADKIRNYILMNITDEKRQEYLHNTYWYEIEMNAGLSNAEETTKFIRYYLQYIGCGIPQKDAVYKDFKTYAKNSDKSIEEILRNMLRISDVYRKIIQQSFDSRDINYHLSIVINDLKKAVVIPFLFDVFVKLEDGDITAEAVVEVLKIVESYLFRRDVCKERSANMDKFFNNLIVEVNNIRDRHKADYLDVFKYSVMTANGIYTFPNDKKFESAIKENSLYAQIPKLCKYMLLRIENYGRDKERVVSDNLTVEHVMPQSTPKNTYWQNYLGLDWQNVYANNVHTLGNLTLTGYNSDLSNKPFEDKKKMDKGFCSSPLKLNKYLSEVDEWNEENIKRRGEMLADIALKCWPSFSYAGNYSYKESHYNSVSLDGDIGVAQGRKPEFAEWDDKQIFASSWKFLYSEVMNLLYQEYQDKMQRAFDFGNQGTFAGIISKTEEKTGLRGEKLWEQIIDDNPIYFYMNNSAVDFLTALIKWFEYLKVDLDSFTVYFKE